MNRSTVLTLFGIAAVLCPAAGIAAQQSPRPMTVDDVLAMRTPSSVAMSPDGSWVAFVVSERNMEADRTVTDVWVVPTEGNPGDARRLTTGEGVDDSPAWHPGGEWLGFASDRGERRHVYGIRPNGGEAWPVTSHDTDVGAFAFSPDGTWIAFLASPPKSEADEELERLRGRPMVQDRPMRTSGRTSTWRSWRATGRPAMRCAGHPTGCRWRTSCGRPIRARWRTGRVRRPC